MDHTTNMKSIPTICSHGYNKNLNLVVNKKDKKKMEHDLKKNGRRPLKKNENGRRPTKNKWGGEMEDDLKKNGRRPQKKGRKKKEDDLKKNEKGRGPNFF